MRPVIRTILAGAVVGSAGVALLGWAGLSQVTVPSNAKALSATVMLPASPEAVWYSVLTPEGICRTVIPACTEVRGSKTRPQFRIEYPVAGKQVAAWAKSRITRQRPARSMQVYLSADSAFGTAQGEVRIRLRAKGHNKTRVAVQVTGLRGTGLLGRSAVPMMEKQFAPGLKRAAKELRADQRGAGTTVKVRWSKRRGGTRLVIRPTIVVPSAALVPPTGSGKIRVYAGNRQVCVAKLRASKARCGIKAPKEGTKVKLVATGTLSSGYRLWNTGYRKFRAS